MEKALLAENLRLYTSPFVSQNIFLILHISFFTHLLLFQVYLILPSKHTHDAPLV